MLKDNYGREINYARISLTDRCNLRCRYCMPPEGIDFKPHGEILSFEEIYSLVEALKETGFTKFRFTGGEPFVRKNAMEFFENLQLKEFFITTNLAAEALDISRINKLKLGGINVSMDTLNPAKFSAMTRGGDINPVLGRLKALTVRPLKLNTVVIKNFNEDEVEQLIKFAAGLGATVRFIEKMDIISNDLGFVSLGEIARGLIKKGVIRDCANAQNNSVAKYYDTPEGKNKVGFITPESSPFCSDCNRIRILANGDIKLCLFSRKIFNIRAMLRNNSNQKALCGYIRDILNGKPFNAKAAKGENIINLPGSPLGSRVIAGGGN